MRLRRPMLAMTLLAGSILPLLPPRGPIVACAPAPHAGERVAISGEAAFLIWNPTTKTEHFIRQAEFDTQAKDFGFLVPTPSQPELGEVAQGNQLFSRTFEMTAAKHVYQTVTKTVYGFGEFLDSKTPEKITSVGFAPDMMPPTATVEVLDEKKVGGFDATVLRADDSDALAEWLKKHGYESRPALTEWLRWYTEHKWVITAFKITTQEPGSPRKPANPVRMSFRTDKPFYPYREPTDMRDKGNADNRSLRLFLLADQKYQGTIGDERQWPGQAEWASPVGTGPFNFPGILTQVDPSLAKLASGANYLTEYVDNSSPRPGTDEVYFTPATDQSPRLRPDIIHITEKITVWPGPIGAYILILLGLTVVVGLLVFNMVRGSKKPRPQGLIG